MSLVVLLYCGSGARERSSQEYKELLTSHGFVDVQTKVIPGTLCNAIFARKP